MHSSRLDAARQSWFRRMARAFRVCSVYIRQQSTPGRGRGWRSASTETPPIPNCHNAACAADPKNLDAHVCRPVVTQNSGILEPLPLCRSLILAPTAGSVFLHSNSFGRFHFAWTPGERTRSRLTPALVGVPAGRECGFYPPTGRNRQVKLRLYSPRHSFLTRFGGFPFFRLPGPKQSPRPGPARVASPAGITAPQAPARTHHAQACAGRCSLLGVGLTFHWPRFSRECRVG